MELTIFRNGGAVNQFQPVDNLILPDEVIPSSIFLSDEEGKPLGFRLINGRVKLLNPDVDPSLSLNVEYTLSDISWRPRYRAIELAEDLRLSSLTLFGSISANSPLNPRLLTLIFRNLPEGNESYRMASSAPMMARMSSSPRMEEAPLVHPTLDTSTETFRLRIPPFSIDVGLTVVPLTDWDQVNIPQIYFVRLGSVDGMTNRGPVDVDFGYRFMATQDFPPGEVLLYQSHHEYSPIPVGRTVLEETRKGSEVTLIFGPTTVVSGEGSMEVMQIEEAAGSNVHRPTDSRTIGSERGIVIARQPEITHVRFSGQLINHSSREVDVFILVRLNSHYVLDSSMPYRIWRGQLEFPTKLPPGKTQIRGELRLGDS